MTVRDAGWVRPEPLGSIGLGLGVRVTPVNGVFMEMRKFGDCDFASLWFTGSWRSPQVMG